MCMLLPVPGPPWMWRNQGQVVGDVCDLQPRTHWDVTRPITVWHLHTSPPAPGPFWTRQSLTSYLPPPWGWFREEDCTVPPPWDLPVLPWLWQGKEEVLVTWFWILRYTDEYLCWAISANVWRREGTATCTQWMELNIFPGSCSIVTGREGTVKVDKSSPLC